MKHPDSRTPFFNLEHKQMAVSWDNTTNWHDNLIRSTEGIAIGTCFKDIVE
jgi:hypothetical protein